MVIDDFTFFETLMYRFSMVNVLEDVTYSEFCSLIFILGCLLINFWHFQPHLQELYYNMDILQALYYTEH